MDRERLIELLRHHDVPGASVAILADGTLTTVAAGVLNVATAVEATPDSLFQIGSITKVYTATQIMRLVERGLVGLDQPVGELLPGFRVADPQVSREVTVRHLLTHTSGINGDFNHDTGRGDDCLARYVAACADLPQNHPLGATLSYCNTGFIVLGHIVERLTGQVWDDALRAELLEPLDLGRTWTLPEDVLRFRAAMGHLTPADGSPRPAPVWLEMRSDGPAGVLNATAADLVAFVRLHLGHGPSGILAEESIATMQRPRATMDHPFGMAAQWGLGWQLDTWSGRRIIGHDGVTVGQIACVRAVPETGLIIAVLTNSDCGGGLVRDVLTETLAHHGIAMPPPPEPPADPPTVDPQHFAGTYERVGVRFELTPELELRVIPTGPVAHLRRAATMRLVPYNEDVLLGRPAGASRWYPFRVLPLNGRRYLHNGAQVTPRIN